MFVGHIGAGLVLQRADRRLGLGTLFFAAMLLDLLLWALVLLGVESFAVPPDFATRHFLRFVFPYSHGLVASLGWSLLAGLAAGRWLAGGSRRAGLVVAAAVFSHFVLDALVHVPELPLLGQGSPQIGLGLWNHPAIGLGVELGLVALGVVLYLPGAGLSRGRAAGLVGFVILLVTMTAAGQFAGQPPPTRLAGALPGLIAIPGIAAFGAWISRAGTGPRP